MQESLGGRCKTVIIATLSPSITAIEESTSTLNYAQSASGIINKPVATSYLSIGQHCNTSSATSSSADPNPGENSNGSSIEYWHEMECRLQYMQAQVEEAQGALARKHIQQQELVEKAEKAESVRRIVEAKLSEAKVKMDTLADEAQTAILKQKFAQSKLITAEDLLRKTNIILKATKETEIHLTTQAKALLSTLGMAVADCDALHDDIRRRKEAEVERTEAAKSFSAASLTVLDETLSSLSALSLVITEHGNSLSDTCDTMNEQGKRSMSAVSSLLCDVTDRVKLMTTAMESQVTDDKGFLRTSKNNSSDILVKVRRIASLVKEGDKVITNTCSNARDHLSSCTTYIKELSSKHAAVSKTQSEKLENDIISTKAYLSNVIKNSQKSITMGENKRASEHEKLSSLLTDWKKAQDARFVSLSSTTTKKKDQLSSAFKQIKDQMHHQDDMVSLLDQQHNFLHTEGDDHISSIATLDDEICLQKNMIDKTQKVQKDLRAKFVSKIMGGVQKLVNEQMQKMSAEIDKGFGTLEGHNEKLAVSNSRIRAHGTEITKKIEETNRVISTHVEASQENEKKAVATIEAAGHYLENMYETSEMQRKDCDDFSQCGNEITSSLAMLHNDTQEDLAAIKTIASVCTSHVSDVMHTSMLASVHASRLGEEKLVKYVSDKVIDSTAASLSDVLAPRTVLIEEVCNSVETIDKITMEQEKVLENIAHEHTRLAKEGISDVIAKEDAFNGEISNKYLEDLSTLKDTLENEKGTLSSTASEALTCSALKTKQVKSNINGFTGDVMKVHSKPDPLPKKAIFEYSERLSFTPADNEILHQQHWQTDNCVDRTHEVGSICTIDGSITTDDKENFGPRYQRRESDESETLSLQSLKSTLSSSTISTSPGTPTAVLSQRCQNERVRETGKGLRSRSHSSKRRSKVSTVSVTGTPSRMKTLSSRKKPRITSTPTRNNTKRCPK